VAKKKGKRPRPTARGSKHVIRTLVPSWKNVEIIGKDRMLTKEGSKLSSSRVQNIEGTLWILGKR